MGGKALNKYGIETQRKNTEEFMEIGLEIKDKLNKYFLNRNINIETYIIKSYHNKETHGDLDLLIKTTSQTNNINLRNVIRELFSPLANHVNGGICSFDYRDFQIDFIPIQEDKWNIAKTYMDYDPLGNIMGKTFHKFGLSYGSNGLFYKFRNFNGKLSKNILLSTDPKKIFDFGGYNYERYLKGFDSLEDIFKFSIDSKYFDSEMFKMENLKSIDRKRNRKRSSYRQFLNYLQDNNINISYKFNKNKAHYLPTIFNYFPEAKLEEKLKELSDIDAKNKLLSQKFNGKIIMQWFPDLKGKELGNAIAKFKNNLGNDYDDFILNSTVDEIFNKFSEISKK